MTHQIVGKPSVVTGRDKYGEVRSTVKMCTLCGKEWIGTEPPRAERCHRRFGRTRNGPQTGR